MYVTKIEHGKGKRYRIYLDDEFVFALYAGELKCYQITEDKWIPDNLVKEILENTIYKRAKERALYLLERRPMSVSMLCNKLYENDYSEDIVSRVVDFLKKYRYLDDFEFLCMYVEAYSSKKSKRQLQYDLMKRGISKDIIEEYFDEHPYSEHICFQKQFEKRIRDKDLSDPRVKQKVFRYFYGKGFPVYLIEEYLNQKK